MAKNTQLSNTVVNAQADALAALANNGFLRIYDGAQPANADTAVTTQVLLAELRLNATAFQAAVNGVLTANAITEDASANATGTASWLRVTKSDGVTVLFDGTVGTSNSNLLLSTVSIVQSVGVAISSFTHAVAKASAGV